MKTLIIIGLIVIFFVVIFSAVEFFSKKFIKAENPSKKIAQRQQQSDHSTISKQFIQEAYSVNS